MGAGSSVEEDKYKRQVLSVFKAIDANESGFLSVSELVAFFQVSDLAEEAGMVKAHRWFYSMNANKDAKVSPPKQVHNVTALLSVLFASSNDE